MAIDLKKILANYEKTYEFVCKVACDEAIADDKLKLLDTILKVKGMIARTTPERLPIQAQPVEFRRLDGFVGYIYVFNMTFKYPITPSEVTNEMSSILGLSRAFISVKTEKNPVEIEEEDYLEYEDEDYLDDIIEDNNFDINVDDYFGNNFKNAVVDALNSEKAKAANTGKFKEVDIKGLKGKK